MTPQETTWVESWRGHEPDRVTNSRIVPEEVVAFTTSLGDVTVTRTNEIAWDVHDGKYLVGTIVLDPHDYYQSLLPNKKILRPLSLQLEEAVNRLSDYVMEEAS